MKIVWILLCVVFFAGCGAKSNEDIAKELITEKLKATLPDFKNYESLNFGTLGTASLPYEETDQSKENLKVIQQWKDSVTQLEKMIPEKKTADTYQLKLNQLQDSIKAASEKNSGARQSYLPEKLFKLSHAYTLKDAAGQEKKTEEEFYIDKDLKKVVKVHKVY